MISNKRQLVEEFLESALVPSPNAKVTTEALLDAFKEAHGEVLNLSVDGFGRLIPKKYKRKMIFRLGILQRGVQGWQLKR